MIDYMIKLIVEENEEQVVKVEVNSFVGSLEKVEKETKGNFIILSWWKTNGSKYPILVGNARHICYSSPYCGIEECF